MADRLHLTPESVALLLRGEAARARAGAEATGKGQASLAQRLLGSEAADRARLPGGGGLQSGASHESPGGVHP